MIFRIRGGNYILKYFFVNISIIFSFPVFSQSIPDTIQIKEVIISSKDHDSSVKSINTEINSVIINKYRHENLADIISENSLIFIKSYGLGGIATTSIRGGGANHTLITWNEISINNPMPGQSDLSLIPAGFIDNIQILPGGSSMALNSGGFGGAINLQTSPRWKKETSLVLNPSIGSFGRYKGSFQFKTGNMSFQTITKVSLESSENNFAYLNNEVQPVREIRKNNQFKQQGYLQELYLKKENSIASARIWYQSATRNLPAPIIQSQTNNGESQFDESLRTMLNYKTLKGTYKYSVTGAFILNRLDYFNRLASIDSRNMSEKLIVRAGLESSPWENITLMTSLSNEVSFINSNNYDNQISRNVLSFSLSIHNERGKRLKSSFLIRETINNRLFLIPDFSAGLEYRISEDGDHLFKGNISRNSKVPDMNDLYWVPGGNGGLKNEYALSSELTYRMTKQFKSDLLLISEISLFKNSIRDMIQWRPGEFSYWTADNIGKVNSLGTETSVGLTWNKHQFISGLTLRHSFTSARSEVKIAATQSAINRQLIYIPENQLNAILNIWYRKFDASWIADYTGRRYITTDNSRYLNGFIVNSIKAGYKINLKESSIDLQFDIKNIFNSTYQVIAWYPSPGRYYSLGILFNLLK